MRKSPYTGEKNPKYKPEGGSLEEVLRRQKTVVQECLSIDLLLWTSNKQSEHCCLKDVSTVIHRDSAMSVLDA